MSRTEQIGFSQRVRLEWLEETARMVMAGNNQTSINTRLQELLKDKVSIGGTAERGNREKIITILMKTWFNPPDRIISLRDDGLELLKRLPEPEHIAIHWGMVSAVYPFWAAVAGQVGRLLKLQGSAAAPHIQRRIREQYGERETVARAARRVLRAFADWGVLCETGTKGVYGQGLSLVVHDTELVAWLLEAFLSVNPNYTTQFNELINNTGLFPFILEKNNVSAIISYSKGRLEVIHHGLNDILVLLKI